MNNLSGLYILLAAGFSRRFGSPKQLHTLPSGSSIINTAIDALTKSGCDFVVAIREDDTALLAHLHHLNISIIKVKNAEQGLSSVIAEATEALHTRATDWIGICLADMPYIQSKTLTDLTSYVTPNTIIRPSYQGKPGHPVLFGRDYFDELTQLAGDDGAKSIIKRFPDALQAIDVEDSMVLYDIDKPESVR
ncbi:nucleotidyltransferase family protein [Alkalimarinus sediminis]|uniref:Nucleotidyltransferase family protein n=1 Tax=Alkalimarinus sediminis TaxID=1632866 RepID=A0A9E8KQ26_9ALTE|nr:nucleotidyltransferase family protein [Alkalimarinus sediminis]UZW74167.1 nucleotidyltransferase family protein [Alkalimarinus sediminis]